VPVTAKEKLRAVTQDLGSQARVARLLGVSPSRVSRWLRTGEQPDAENRRKVSNVEFVMTRLLEVFHRETALDWLQGINAHLRHRRPIDLLAEGRIVEVLGALEAEETGAYA